MVYDSYKNALARRISRILGDASKSLIFIGILIGRPWQTTFELSWQGTGRQLESA
jgi:hypothetical protein